ncbi:MULTISPECIES: LemA family protein [Clostridium]|uniref:LemA family protein n=2 Tax=Clostridium TaxID=1485 RepID=A0A151AKU8_9CLOT|nr:MULTISPECIES: LemA family protein [Clostridium]KYH28248.1 LemA family protein [Clostridium colicanis DSM 13634]MBE6044324.1 LemA family protein [Clostridium thermopalmarium]PRR76543.1 LemA family protein [Clostridium thermopalmarium DSM 5974]PVZ28344.1 LemA protein [Clostridium thermopalmarium DSM 5974]
MGKVSKTLIAIIAVILILIVPIISGYNKIISLEQKVETVEANIDTELQRRNDLIPNLVNTVKGYASQESEVIGNVVEARAKLGGAKTVEDRANADAELSSALSRLLVVVERYPELKSNQNFRDLTVALEGTENRIKIARQDYNNAVSEYNTTIRRFPNSIVARIFGFDEKQYYKAAEGAKEVPKVDFTK